MGLPGVRRLPPSLPFLPPFRSLPPNPCSLHHGHSFSFFPPSFQFFRGCQWQRIFSRFTLIFVKPLEGCLSYPARHEGLLISSSLHRLLPFFILFSVSFFLFFFFFFYRRGAMEFYCIRLCMDYSLFLFFFLFSSYSFPSPFFSFPRRGVKDFTVFVSA